MTDYQRLVRALKTVRELAEGEYSGTRGGNLAEIVPKEKKAEFVKLAGNVVWILGMSIESAGAKKKPLDHVKRHIVEM